MFISLEERLTRIFNSRHVTPEWPKSPISLPLRNSACSRSPNPDLRYNSPSLSLRKTICLHFLQNSISKEQFTFPSSSSLHYAEKNNLLFSFIIFLMPVQGKSSLLPQPTSTIQSFIWKSHLFLQPPSYLRVSQLHEGQFFPFFL